MNDAEYVPFVVVTLISIDLLSPKGKVTLWNELSKIQNFAERLYNKLDWQFDPLYSFNVVNLMS